MFDADGNFAAQLMDPDRAGDYSEGYVANWGVYEVDEERQTFTLTFIGSVQAATMGLRTVRHVNFKDDTGGVAIFNTDPQVVDGLEEQSFITWERISPAPPA
jgi:Lipocalin-like domain